MMTEGRLPTFIIGGAPRSGTTFLCHVLDKHPDVYIAKPYIPEAKVCMMPCAKEPDGYIEQYHRLFLEAGNQSALGEKTSYYLENMDACQRLKKSLKKIKFVFIVREPVARAYSNYLWSCKNKIEHLSFSEAIEQEETRPDPFAIEKPYVKPFNYLSRGDYATFAERYYTNFGKENVEFLLFEDIKHKPDYFYRTLQLAVNVEPLPRKTMELGPINSTEKTEAMDPALEQNLREHMRPKIERFANLTGLDVGAWGY